MVDNSKTALVIAIIALLTSIGIPVTDKTIGQGLDELNGYYVCDVLGADSLGKYARVSSTAYSAYPYADSNAGYKRCTDGATSGKWLTVKAYADSIGIDPYELLAQKEPQVEVPSGDFKSRQVKCGQTSCYEA